MLQKRELALCALAAFVLFALLRFVIFDIQSVQGDSMLPTLADGAVVLVLRAPFAGKPRQGEVVTLESQGESIVKRIAAVGPCSVSWEHDSFHIMDDSIHGAQARSANVPEGSVFLLGDNPATSIDSRSFGARAFPELSGRVIAVLSPLGALAPIRALAAPSPSADAQAPRSGRAAD